MDVIEDALAIHARISAGLKVAIRAPQGVDPSTIRTDRTCEFGVWIYGAEGMRHSALPEYQSLKDVHKRFHQAAYVALCLCRTGKRADAEHSITEGEFQQLSQDMIARLLALKRALRAPAMARQCVAVP